jgi:O-antigen ligase
MQESMTLKKPWRTLSEWFRLWALVWSGPEEQSARISRQTFVDVLFACLGLVLPWSTSIASGLAVALILTIVPTLRIKAVVEELRRPALFLPVLLVLLAAAGVTWAFAVPWPQRLNGLDKMTKLLVLPLVFVHFQQSRRASWIFSAFVLSNLVLLSFSWFLFVFPQSADRVAQGEAGVFVKNYIDQSQAFCFLIFALAVLSIEAWRKQNAGGALALALLAAALFTNLMFVNVARTAFFYLPIMLLIFAWSYLPVRYVLMSVVTVAVVFCGLWSMSPNLQKKISRVSTDFSAYQTSSQVVNGEIASGAERLELWRKSIDFIHAAPLFGHGTGSIKRLFDLAAIDKTGLASIVASNPHNQILAVAIQWGGIGCVILGAMWISHVLLFYRFVARAVATPVGVIGLLAVAQNIISSMFNAHLSDFYEGWLYVLAVAIAGGQLYRPIEDEKKESPLKQAGM